MYNVILLKPLKDISKEQSAVLQLLLTVNLQLNALYLTQGDLQHRRFRADCGYQHVQPLCFLCVIPRQAGCDGYLQIIPLIIFIFSMIGH